MEIIILIIIISLLAVILFLALKKLIESITADSKEYYFKKVQDLDKQLDEKKSELDNLNEKEIIEEEQAKELKIENNNLDKNLLDVFASTDYSDGNALKVSNQVDDIFVIDEKQILKDFITNIKVSGDYENMQKLLDRFSPNLIYKLKMVNNSSQIKLIKEMITDEEYEIFDSYLKYKKFKLNDFLRDLELLVEKNKPIIEVLVGSKRKDYSDMSPYIKMIYSEDIYKGMIIKYQGKIYDYSINERDV